MFNFSGGNHDKEHERLIRQGRVIPYTTTTLPAATTANTGQRVSYNNVDYYSDGTRWLSTQEFVLGMATFDQFINNLSATNNSQMTTRPHQSSSIYVTGFEAAFKTNTTLNSTNFWNITLTRTDNTGAIAAVGTAISSYNLAKGFTVAGTLYADGVAPNVVLTPAQSLRFFINVGKVSTPGNLELSGCVIRYLLIAA